MSAESEKAAEVLRTVWQGTPGAMTEMDEECTPNKVGRNMKDVSYDGFAEEGVDMATAWKNKLAREGKLGSSSLGDLVLGQVD